MGTKVTKYETGKDGKTRRAPPAKAGKTESPEVKPGDVKKNTPGNPAV